MPSPSPTPQSPATGGPTPPPGMIHVPAGPFFFGKTEATLADFWIDQTPVTNAQYAEFVKKTGRRHPTHWSADGPPQAEKDHPVVNVTFADAEAFAAHAGKQLPTPAQFEKAARGTDRRKYPWGDEVGLRTSNTKEAGVGGTTPVDKFPRGRSPFGCFDLAGNVLHWTRGVADAKKGTRVLKGSSWKIYLGACSWSNEADPEKKQDDVGFRCVWTPKA